MNNEYGDYNNSDQPMYRVPDPREHNVVDAINNRDQRLAEITVLDDREVRMHDLKTKVEDVIDITIENEEDDELITFSDDEE